MHGQNPRTRTGFRALGVVATLALGQRRGERHDGGEETEVLSYNFHPLPAHQRAVADLILEIL